MSLANSDLELLPFVGLKDELLKQLIASKDESDLGTGYAWRFFRRK